MVRVGPYFADQPTVRPMLLSIQNLTITYRKTVRAIDDMTLAIRPGMFGLLGPNGAGKSSLMRTIATLQFPDVGTIQFNGTDIFADLVAFRSQLGYLPQEFGVYPGVSAEALLRYLATLKGITDRREQRRAVGAVLELTNLNEVKDRAVSTYSGGMRRRFGIAQLLLANPRLIIVDEPTAGLDPSERTRFLNVLRRVAQDNVVLFSTHLVEDVAGLCNDMAVLDRGQLLARTEPQRALRELGGKIWIISDSDYSKIENHGDGMKLSEQLDPRGQTVFRIFATRRPAPNARSTEPTLSDYYFLTLNSAAHVV